ncbi:MAG TPA: 4-aminobutyrate--2-oxoglutarate transaminase, partial [Bacillota bacterium]|nr:4-aminobutyrate--2-oxoglutarate transaminase [Bacillota bacterium]
MINSKRPHMITTIPGPKAQVLLKLRERYVPKGVSLNIPTFINQGQGALVEDVDGNILLDFAGGIGVQNIGYSHPEIIEVIKSQAEKYLHSSINVISYDSYIYLAEKMDQIIPGDSQKKTMFANSGAESVENAIKIARRYTKKTDIIAFEGAFHGRTLLTMSLTSKVKPYKYGFTPLVGGIHKVPYAYCYRCEYGLKQENCGIQCAEKLEQILETVLDPEDVAALIMEPIQGEGGFVVPPDEFVSRVKKICEKNNILFIADEIQTGFCRTGKMFASDYWSIEPDIVTTAKSLAAGLPLSAVTARKEIMEAPQAGGIGGTFSGNPLACAAAIKVIEVMLKEDFAGKAQKIGEICMKRFMEMKEKYSLIGDVRGKGAMVAIELVKDRMTKKPAKEETEKILNEAYQKGLILLSAGMFGNVIRILVPLVVTEEQLNSGMDILEEAIK